ncbi:hypothetical protein TTHERM_00689930 (macronuclear) [Tetrahymena thermophila SB210]|uniref:Uncharacterized protein n=1 Tax=Tetrahymena thermophila (strain SB210) TaxID=312017 RepID=I7MAZ0_TETTS|nr:hypothetical protein TTHERM_00689930 [Tetrahymena thermophila SB210]EAS06754.1 hypothetical protein TTHERM_00689930 [Tetrahymena thermophila SB210]|eukprot:XP_001026996.1 hypothetical protein TTHERM_00689930 [Tetrahymena thermophila SB210]
MNKKRRFLGKLIADLQNNSVVAQSPSLSHEPKIQKKRLIAVPMYYNIQPLYEFFLIGEINLELQLDSEEEYFPIGIKQSPLNKWRPFVKAEQFHNRIEMTIDASYQGISEFEFIIQKLQCCSNDVYKQLAHYLQAYQHFIRRIKEKMLQNPVPPRLYEYKFQNFLKKATEYVDSLPIDGLYAVSILQLDYNIYNTKRIKFIVSKALAEIVGGVDQAECANILLRKGWLEVFGGSQRIMKNIMLLNRLMKEGRQLLTFKIYTVDKILIQVEAEIEIVQNLRTFVDVGFVEVIRFTISPETRSYLYQMRKSDNQLKSLPYELYFNNKTFDPLPPSTSLTYSAFNKENPISKQLRDQQDDNLDAFTNQQSYTQRSSDTFKIENNCQQIFNQSTLYGNYYQNNGSHSQRSSIDEDNDQRSQMPIKKEEEETSFSYKKFNSTNASISKRSRSNSNSSNYSNQDIPGAMTLKELEQHVDKQEQKQRSHSDQSSVNDISQTGKNKRHPNYDQHELDEKYSKKSQAFIERFYSEQEVQKILLNQAAAAAPKKLVSPNIQGESQQQTEQKNDFSSRADSLDVRSNTSSISENININILSSPEQNIYKNNNGQKQEDSQKTKVNYQLIQNQINQNNFISKNQYDQSKQNTYNIQPNELNQQPNFQKNQLFQFASKAHFQQSSNNLNQNTLNKQSNNNNVQSNIFSTSQYPEQINEDPSQLNHISKDECFLQDQTYIDQDIYQQKNKIQKSDYGQSQDIQLQYQTDYPQNYNNYQKDEMQNYCFEGNELQQPKSQNGLQEYDNQHQYQELGGEDLDLYDHHYFNIFDDESLGCKFEELQQEQKKLHKMIYHQQYY